MTTDEAEPATTALPDRAGDVTVALSPRDLAFLALIAGLILALLRRVARRRRGSGLAADGEG